MKIALCLSGELRFFDNILIKTNFDKFIFKFEPDLFISTWKHFGESMNHGYINPFDSKINQDNITEQIKLNYKNIKGLEIEDFNTWILSLNEESKNIINNKNFDSRTVNSLPQIYKIYKSNLLKKIYETDNNFKYDIVIRSRFDNLFIQDLDFNFIKKSTIYNINFQGNFYPNRIYDIFFFGDSLSMDTISDTYNCLSNLLKNDFDNGLCKRDACRLLFVQSITNNLNVETIDTRVCDVYRGTSFDEYFNYLKKLGGVNK